MINTLVCRSGELVRVSNWKGKKKKKKFISRKQMDSEMNEGHSENVLMLIRGERKIIINNISGSRREGLCRKRTPFFDDSIGNAAPISRVFPGPYGLSSPPRRAPRGPSVLTGSIGQRSSFNTVNPVA